MVQTVTGNLVEGSTAVRIENFNGVIQVYIIRTSGIEPELLDWKSNSLPLTYIRTIVNCGFYLSCFSDKIYTSNYFIEFHLFFVFVQLSVFQENLCETKRSNYQCGLLSSIPY